MASANNNARLGWGGEGRDDGANPTRRVRRRSRSPPAPPHRQPQRVPQPQAAAGQRHPQPVSTMDGARLGDNRTRANIGPAAANGTARPPAGEGPRPIDDNNRGARLTFAQIVASGPARPPAENDPMPEIHACFRDATVRVLFWGEDVPKEEKVYLMRQENATRAYRRLPHRRPKPLDHHAPKWGHVVFGMVLDRIGEDDVFREPPPGEAKYVAIKKLNEQVVKAYLEAGGHEDPYKELARMQEIGDDVHVLRCLDALRCEKYLYIISTYCNSSLREHIPWAHAWSRQGPLPEDQVREIWGQILEDLLYLQRHGICHHDVSPDNFLVLNDRVVLNDFAMSLRFHQDEQQHRWLLTPQGQFGKGPYGSPEVFAELQPPFDGVAADLWSAAVILYNLLTGHFLYCHPSPRDINFTYFLMAGALSGQDNERTAEILMDVFQPGDERQVGLMARAIAHSRLSPGALETLTHLLAVDPSQRWTLAQAVESDWLQGRTPTSPPP